MQVFISWSGETSLRIAEALGDWLERTIQAVDSYHSDQMEKGAAWRSKLLREINKSDFGLICLTEENLHSDWLHFEAGALFRELREPSVSPVLFRVRGSNLNDPLATFQYTKFERDDMLSLVKTINGQLDQEDQLKEGILNDSFGKYWDDLEEKIEQIYEETPPEDTGVEKDDSEIIREILENTRTISRNILESRQEVNISSMPTIDLNEAEIYLDMVEKVRSRLEAEDMDEHRDEHLKKQFTKGLAMADESLKKVSKRDLDATRMRLNDLKGKYKKLKSYFHNNITPSLEE